MLGNVVDVEYSTFVEGLLPLLEKVLDVVHIFVDVMQI